MKKEDIYFVYDREGDGYTEHETLKEALDLAKEAIENQSHEDGVLEELMDIRVGKVTHMVEQCDRIERPVIIDENQFDEDGMWWHPSCTFIANYKMIGVD